MGYISAPCENIYHGNKEISLAILSRMLAQSCTTLCLNYVGRVTHDCASILDSIAKGISLFPGFFAWCKYPTPTSPFIQLNDFCTKFVPRIFYGSRINAITRMRTCVGLLVSMERLGGSLLKNWYEGGLILSCEVRRSLLQCFSDTEGSASGLSSLSYTVSSCDRSSP